MMGFPKIVTRGKSRAKKKSVAKNKPAIATNWLRWGVSALLVTALLAVVLYGMGLYAFANIPINVPPGTTVNFFVKPGDGLIRVSKNLESQGLISSARQLRWLVSWEEMSDQVKTGEYEFTSGLLPGQVLEMLVAGRVKQYSITVVEGWSFRQMLQAVHAHEKIDKKLVGVEPDALMAALGQGGIHPEGRFLPDTYQFPAGTTDIDFLKRAYRAMDDYLNQQWQTRDPSVPYADPIQALTMASIVEKETGASSERDQIAGVFVRRLEKKMRLQTDPTVIYGMGASYKGNITKRDLLADTPYNTYVRKGLPPTPIALPGREAIRAALHPAEGDALFFVAKGDGSHHFSATIEEHEQAVKKYQKHQRRKDYRSAPTAVDTNAR